MSALTDWAASVLETDEDILVPVKKLWKAFLPQAPTLSLEEFVHALEAEERFEWMQVPLQKQEPEPWAEEDLAAEVARMEEQGYYGGPRVKLKARAITLEHVASMIKKHTDLMMNSLWSAYDIRPADLGEDGEAELLNLIAEAKALQLELDEALKHARENKDSSQDDARAT